jgi:hypothetical protein
LNISLSNEVAKFGSGALEHLGGSNTSEVGDEPFASVGGETDLALVDKSNGSVGGSAIINVQDARVREEIDNINLSAALVRNDVQGKVVGGVAEDGSSSTKIDERNIIFHGIDRYSCNAVARVGKSARHYISRKKIY